MKVNTDFKLMVTEGYTLVYVNILYYLPDQRSILNEFTWSTLDLTPRYPRIHEFLSFWSREIEGKIKEVRITDTKSLKPRDWRAITEFQIE